MSEGIGTFGLRVRKLLTALTAAAGAGMLYAAMALYQNLPSRNLEDGATLQEISWWLWPVGFISLIASLIIPPAGQVRTIARVMFVVTIAALVAIHLADDWFFHDDLIWWP